MIRRLFWLIVAIILIIAAAVAFTEKAHAAPGWGAAVAPTTFTDNFTNLKNWGLYDSPGQDGAGLRRPSQIHVSGGILTITGSADGTTGGMQLNGHDQQYGTFSVRMRSPKGTGAYHPVVLLWGVGSGSGVNAPTGEIDLVEAWNRPNRDKNDFTLHYGDGSQMVGGSTSVDMTVWHTYNVSWTKTGIWTWIDDQPAYFTTTDKAKFPQNKMQLCIQLDWFPHEGFKPGPASMQVDWVKITPWIH